MDEDPQASTNPVLYVKLAFLLYLAYYAQAMISGRWHWSFLDRINFPIHEFGHLLFTPLGEFAHFLGGSLFQVLFPLILVGAFVFQLEFFGAAVCTFWAGESIINVSYYVADAYEQKMELLGGGIHDWAWMLERLDLLHKYQTISSVVFFCGSLVMIASLSLAFWLVFREGKWIQFETSPASGSQRRRPPR